MPLAFTQEDFLVCILVLSRLVNRYGFYTIVASGLTAQAYGVSHKHVREDRQILSH